MQQFNHFQVTDKSLWRNTGALSI